MVLGARDPADAFSRAFIPPCNPLTEEVDNSRTRRRGIDMIATTGTLDIYWVCVPDPGYYNRGPQALRTGLASPVPTTENPYFRV